MIATEKAIYASQLRTGDQAFDDNGNSISIARIGHGADGEVILVTWSDGVFKRYDHDQVLGIVRAEGDSRPEVTWDR